MDRAHIFVHKKDARSINALSDSTNWIYQVAYRVHWTSKAGAPCKISTPKLL